MPHKNLPRPTKDAVLLKMQVIADRDHGGDLDRHCLTIFLKLTSVEQEVFIEAFITIWAYFHSTARIEEERAPVVGHYSEESRAELAAMEYSQRSRTRLIEMVVGVICLVMIWNFIVLPTWFPGSKPLGGDTVGHLVDVFKIMFNTSPS